MKKQNLIIGKKYNKLTILDNIYIKNSASKVLVKCDCGNIYQASKYGVKMGYIKQCIICWRYGQRVSRRQGIKEMSGSSWKNILRNAKSRGLNITITKEQIYNLYLKQEGKCALTGLDIKLDNYKKGEQTASLDRIDSSGDYTLDNVQWIHKKLNRLKNNYSISELIYWTDLIKKYVNNESKRNSSNNCPNCNSVGSLILEGGCNTCKQCGYSRCE